MTPKHTTIANHLNATSFTDADKRLLRQCFLAAVGPEGAAPPVAEPAGWVIEDTHPPGAPTVARLWWRGAGILGNLDAWGKSPAAVTPFPTREAAEALCRGWPFCRILPYAEALRLDAAEQALKDLPAHTRKVLDELGDEEPSAEVLAADDSEEDAPSGPWVVAVTMRGERRWDTGIASPTADLAAAKRWDVRADADARANEWRYYPATVLPLAEAERLAGAAPTPAPTPKPPREVVGYRVRDVPERRYVEADYDGFWRPAKAPKVVTREEAERLRGLAVEWACESGLSLRFRLVPVTRRQRPDVAAAIAACEEGLAKSEDPRTTFAAACARMALRTALAALRGQR